MFNNLTRYKAIVVSTEKQCQDISQYIENKIPVINIPVGYVANLKYQFDINQKDKNHIISIARLVENKQITHQIEVIKAISNQTSQNSIEYLWTWKWFVRISTTCRRLSFIGTC